MSKRRIGVLVMSYGTPESLEQVEAYYTDIRRGHPPSAEQLKELTNRYEAIVGGVFPLRENTNKQVKGLQDQLNETTPNMNLAVIKGLSMLIPSLRMASNVWSRMVLRKLLALY